MAREVESQARNPRIARGMASAKEDDELRKKGNGGGRGVIRVRPKAGGDDEWGRNSHQGFCWNHKFMSK
jgi:hypothetical protein